MNFFPCSSTNLPIENLGQLSANSECEAWDMDSKFIHGNAEKWTTFGTSAVA